MIRIGMIGADSTHTEMWSRCVNPDGAPLAGRARVVKLWGEDPAQAREKAAQSGIAEVVSDPRDALQGVDAAMICNRYGDDHTPHARAAIEAGLPTFVDKPFANDLDDVRAIVALAHEKGVPLMSCSSFRFASEMLALQAQSDRIGAPVLGIATGPAAGNFPNPRARHPFFYGVHVVEILHTMLGPGIESVTTHRTPHSDVAVIRYADGRQGVVNLLREAAVVYHGLLYGKSGAGQLDIQDHNSYYPSTLDRFLTMVDTGTSPVPTDWTVEIIATLAAIVRSAETGGQTVRLNDL